MNRTTKQLVCIVLLLMFALAGLLTVIPSNAMSSGSVNSSKTSALPMQSDVKSVVGTYAGSVIITEPFPLGTLDLVFSIDGESTALEGRVIPGKTQVFLGAPSLAGSISTSDGITPTIQLESERFTDEISGRQVQRRFSLIGEVQNNSNQLAGTYREIIEGFKPQPMEIIGTFSVVRPAGAEIIIDIPPTPTPTPMPTETLAPGQPTPTRTPFGPTATATTQPEQPTATATAQPEQPTPPATSQPEQPTPTSVPPANEDPDGNGGNTPSTLFLPLIANGSSGRAASLSNQAVQAADGGVGASQPSPEMEYSWYLPLIR
ncbi:MAG: hypothetical protein AAF702_07120 [Chloroflexota bacterium]